MRVCILSIAGTRPKALEAASGRMAQVLRAKGYEVDLVSGAKGESPRFALADYVIMATEPVGLRGQLPARVRDLLGQSTGQSGKRSMAVVLKRGPFRNKTINRLMKAMEAEGMSVNDWAVVSSAKEAGDAAAGAPVERSV